MKLLKKSELRGRGRGLAAFLPAWRAVVLAAGVAVAHGAWAAGPSLIHRWSFNGDYADSVGGADFTGTDNSSSVTFINDNRVGNVCLNAKTLCNIK